MGKAEDRVAELMAQEERNRKEAHRKLAKEIGDKITSLVPAFVKNIEALDYPSSDLSPIFNRRMIKLNGESHVAWRLVMGYDLTRDLDILADGTLVYDDYSGLRVVQPSEVWDLYRSYHADREVPNSIEQMADFRKPRTKW